MKFFVNSGNRYFIDSIKEYKVYSDKTRKYEKLNVSFSGFLKFP